MADTTEGAAAGADIEALLRGLANGERAYFWGQGEVKGVGEARLTLWQDGGRLRLEGRGGVDFGAFGSLLVAWRFMAPIMAEDAGVER